jgi:dipeptidyl aminopeptidase/acylaminoacyl peptidase
MKVRNALRIAVWIGAAGLVFASTVAAQTSKPLSVDELLRMHRVSEAQISPDGKWVVYTVATPDIDANRNAGNIWMVATGGGEPVMLTQSGHDSSPVWSPDGKSIAFLSSRDGNSEIYVLTLGGGEARKWTHIWAGVDIVKWSPDGKVLLFTAAVYPDCKDDACNKDRDEAKEKNKVKAHVATELLYRHWTHWNDGKRGHLFVLGAPTDGGTVAASGEPRDLTLGANYDVPPDERGGPEDIAFSPDGTEICFTAVTDKMEAISTNGDLFIVPVAGGTEPKLITGANKGFDGGPVYSPDGKYIAYHAQLTPEYESDRWRVMLYDRASGKIQNLSEGFDRSAGGLAWSANSKKIYFEAEDETLQPIYAMDARVGAQPEKVVADSFNMGISLSADGKTLAFERSSLVMPAEIFVAGADGSGVRQITHHNSAALAQIDMNPAETFWFTSADDVKVQAMVIRPPRFDATKKYPMVVLLHGGPQTMWTNSWGYRWNEELFASQGWVMLMINRRGSTGYGQKFTDDITNDWGGKPYQDIMTGTEAAIAKYSFIDGTHVAAAGASYGGYMADWLATHTGRFKAIVSHAGIYDKTAMFATEELWFEEHDMQGTPWGNPESYKKWSPSTYAGDIGKYKTPTLVICGETDYRVPYSQSLEFFSALQRQGVPSKLVVFPDEGHWILKPQNSQFWYATVFDWLKTYLQ